MEKLLNSDWLRAEQLKCNTTCTGVKSETQVHITHCSSEL